MGSFFGWLSDGSMRTFSARWMGSIMATPLPLVLLEEGSMDLAIFSVKDRRMNGKLLFSWCDRMRPTVCRATTPTKVGLCGVRTDDGSF